LFDSGFAARENLRKSAAIPFQGNFPWFNASLPSPQNRGITWWLET